ncbi:recombinase family protein [Paraburkholderia sp. HD33-4]|uniref:recombinase family protein n=1 Tax=Paraburkholderia sp. HD33-4 TaxID=2883242 RepID=UPI001F250B8A|nr:recombinase family protein [Paraburkholderia sp. HD33-4]
MKKTNPMKAAASAGAVPRLFVYGRFSSARQEKGDSFERQMNYAHKWAADHGYTVDEKLTMFDPGLSAYKNEHITKGALGVFLAALRDPKLNVVQPGDVLLVESLDRLSRAEPIDAQDQFNDIVRAGVTIVTSNDNQIYSRDGLARDPNRLFLALAVMIRAHEESASKAKRIRSAYHAKCANWQKKPCRIKLGSDPDWVRWNEETQAFDLIPDRAFGIRALFDLYRDGYGPRRAFELMRERNIPIPKGISDTYRLYAVMSKRALIGEKTATVQGVEDQGIETTTYTLPGYYPALLTEAEFASLQFLRGQRGRRITKGDTVNILSGLGITFCAHCGFAMAGQNVQPYVRIRSPGSKPSPHAGFRRIMCSGLQKRGNACPAGGCKVDMLERAVMKFCSDQMNLSALFRDTDAKQRDMAERLVIARQTVAETEAAIRKFMDAAGIDDQETPELLVAHTRKLQAQLGAERNRVTECEHELEALQRLSHPAVAQVWAELREGVEALNTDARMKVRRMISDTFKRIEIALPADRTRIGVRFVSKHDIQAIVWLDRKTGEYLTDPVCEPVEVDDRNHAALENDPRPRRTRRAA